MIVNVRGTSGSGKSTIVRKLMSYYKYKVPIYAQPQLLSACLPTELIRIAEKSRKNPIANLCHKSSWDGTPGSLIVLGSYATPCGGCDTIPSYERIFELVRHFDKEGYHVIFEGLLLSAVVNQVVDLWNEKKKDMLIIALDVPLEVCLEGVAKRRAARNEEKPLDPTNTEAKWKGINRSLERLTEAGVPNIVLSREKTLKRIREEFDI